MSSNQSARGSVTTRAFCVYRRSSNKWETVKGEEALRQLIGEDISPFRYFRYSTGDFVVTEVVPIGKP